MGDGAMYSAQLERLLENARPGRHQVLNFAVSGYLADQIEATYERFARPFVPDLVLWPVAYEGYAALRQPVPARHRPLRARRPRWHQLHGHLANSFLFKALRGEYRAWLGPLLADWAGRDRPAVAGTTAADVLARFIQARAREGIPVGVVGLLPIRAVAANRPAPAGPSLRAWAADRPGAFLIDTEPLLADKVSRADRIYWGDYHPNARVHDLYAQAIFSRLLPVLDDLAAGTRRRVGDLSPR